jgi:hypothetical protein
MPIKITSGLGRNKKQVRILPDVRMAGHFLQDITGSYTTVAALDDDTGFPIASEMVPHPGQPIIIEYQSADTETE